MKKQSNKWKLRKLYKVLYRINQLSDTMREQSDEELAGITEKLRNRLNTGESEQSILPEAYAAMREAMRRVLGIYLYDVQILGAVALYQGKMAEMKTGEGKTYTAVLPLYLNALTGRSTILVTVNPYLASRDGNMLAPLYEFMGIHCEVGIPQKPKTRLDNKDKKRIYSADIVYTTNGALGFDYLLENLLVSEKDRYLRPFDFVIIDEADAVLLDAAQTPLVISGMPKVQSNLYDSADFFVNTLKNSDYDTEEKEIWLTESGIRKAERFFGIEKLYDGNHYEFIRHIMLALRAHHSYDKDRNYVVEKEQVRLLDINTGRILDNTKLQAGQHQAIEAKEGVKHTQVHRAMASITYQDFFHLFPKLSGMTGTAQANAKEFRDTYGMDVAVIPTNHPVIRTDEKVRIYTTREAEIEAALQYLLEIHQTGRPILVVTESIAMTEIVSELLLEYELPHNVLNAYNTAKEAAIIAEAGRKDSITVATLMAGRGTDIRLDDASSKIGGLAVIGIGQMKNRSLEMQARGRAGRQGDPGSSIFFVSLEDKVVQDFGKEALQKYTGNSGETHSRWIRHQVKRAQRISEENEREARRVTMEYGESMRLQREIVYHTRRKIQKINAFQGKDLLRIEREVIRDYLQSHRTGLSRSELDKFILDQISYQPDRHTKNQKLETMEQTERYLLHLAKIQLIDKLSQFPKKTQRTEFIRIMILKAIDEAWIEEVDYLQQLKSAMEGRKFSGNNMMYEYHLEAADAYQRMQKNAKKQMMRNILLGEIQYQKDGEMLVILP